MYRKSSPRAYVRWSANSMPEPTLRVRRSARRFPENTLRDTMWRCSSVFRNRSSNSAERSRARWTGAPAGCRSVERWAVAERAKRLCLSRGLEDLADDRVGPDALGLALEVHDHAVAQRGRRDVADVVDRHSVAALEQRADLGGEDDRLQAARRRAVAHELLRHPRG